ncbi:hypothetical protein B0H14DRAFT_3904260 [Mycena olivaceomarginata]|nr:hypothetical protein B0H14DRAFT_3904260 [Mycena olivaceomarginata]
MPADMRLPLDNISVQCALPVWHAGSHKEACQSANSLSYKPGVGRSDGEGVERTWVVLNPAAFHTKDMSKGNRVDILEDKIDSHNFLKNLGLGDSLHRKLVLARAERDRQVEAFKQVSSTVGRDVQANWQQQINDWLQDETKPNPYILDQHDGPTEAQLRAELKRDEERDAATGKVSLHGTSAIAFLSGGLQIEDAQRRIIAELAGTRDCTGRGSAGSKHSSTTSGTCQVYMPYELPEDERAEGCVPGLLEMEAKIRAAQCGAALTVLRGCLHAKRHFITFRDDHLTGQKKTTKCAHIDRAAR